MKKQRINTDNLWSEKASTAIEFCDQNYGAIMTIKREFDRRTGTDTNRCNFTRWFHKDPAKRVEPLFGVGTVLLEVCERVMRQAKDPARN